MIIKITNGIMTVFDQPSQFNQDMDNFQKYIGEANKIMDQIRQQQEYNLKILNTPITPTPTIPQQVPQIPQAADNSWWQQFLDRGNYSAHHPQSDGLVQHMLDTDFWANFLNDVIKKTLWMLWTSFTGISHWLCLLICVAGIISFIAGWKKGGVVSILSILFYMLLKLINMAIGG